MIDLHVHSFGPQLAPDGRPAALPCMNVSNNAARFFRLTTAEIARHHRR